jgi:hypothetical protein
MGNDLGLLEREEIIIADVDESKLKELEEDSVIVFSEKNLGYTPPGLLLERSRVYEQKKKANLSLLNALKIAGIKPFTAESVAKYQKKMTREFRIITSENTSNYVQGISLAIGVLVLACSLSISITHCFKGILNIVFAVYAILGVAAILIYVLHNFWDRVQEEYKRERGKDHWSLAIFPAILLVAYCISFFFSGFIFIFLAVIFLGPPTKKWEKFPLSGYTGHVPRFALETAQEIKMRCSGAELIVEQLINKPDPFLVAVFEEECYYVEVWKEPKYKQERQV